MRSLFPVLLLVAGLALGFFGYVRYDDSGSSLSVGDIEISASDGKGRTESYLLFGLGAFCLLAGGSMLSRGKA